MPKTAERARLPMTESVTNTWLNIQQVDGWYFLLSPSFGKHKHLAVDNVKMLTYYGSVDSGLEDNRVSGAASAQHTNGVSC